jgi:hypothetical protein
MAVRPEKSSDLPSAMIPVFMREPRHCPAPLPEPVFVVPAAHATVCPVHLGPAETAPG